MVKAITERTGRRFEMGKPIMGRVDTDKRYGYGVVDVATRLQMIQECHSVARLREIVAWDGNQKTVQRAAEARLRKLEKGVLWDE